MKRSFVVIWAVALLVVTIPLIAVAGNPLPPHYGSGVVCITCHTSTPNGPGHLDGLVVSSPAIYNNVCQNCHRPGDAIAAAKPMAAGDASEALGGQGTSAGVNKKQTSHRWDGPLTNPAAGALPPVLGPMTTASASYTSSYDLSGRTGNQLACVRCHAPHLNPNPNGNVLRMANDQDQMCMDCHRSRAQQSHLSGTHPVNVNYATAAATGSFNAAIKNANPSNTTSDLQTKLTATGNIVCSTCHGVHYTDSRSSTFDGPSSAKGRYNYANLSTGDGYILRTDRRGAAVASGQPDNLNICTNCHTGKMNHNVKNQNIQCTDCHGAHVEYDPTNSSVLNPQNKPNVYLIRRNPEIPGANKIYFRYTGSQREYKNANNTGVCQSCHAVPTGPGFPAAHNSATATAGDCNACHTHGSPKGSFSVACDGCHGNPPTTNALAGPNGLASPATGALGGTLAGNDGAVGAHAKHAVLHNMACNTCHNGYEQRAMPSTTIDMGFAINGTNVPGFKGSITGGTYNNTGALLNGYSFTLAGNGTNRTCSTVYCHGGTLTPGYVASPNWTGNASQVGCGTCHSTVGDELTMGSHIVHAGSTQQLVCETCHPTVTGTSHMQGSVQWDLSAIGAGAQYKPAGTGTVYATAGETGKVAPSAAYGTCSNIVCHGQATNITWGGTLYSTTETCAKCHSSQLSVATDNAFYSTATPKVTSNSDAKVGAHNSHLNGTDKISSPMTCNDCHGTVAAVNQAGHMNGTLNFNWGALADGSIKSGVAKTTPTYSNGTCSNYCHGATLSGGTNKTPTWNSTTYLPATLSTTACGTCHGFPPVSHTQAGGYGVAVPTGFPLTGCSCHPTINPAGTSYANIFQTGGAGEKHLDGLVDVASGGCNGCHGYPPANKSFAASAGNWADAKMENYTGGGGAHTVAGHIKPTAVAGEAFTNCTPCHNASDHAMSPLAFNPSSNIKVRIDSRVRFASNIQAKYSSNKKDGAQHVPGRCSSVACHFQKSPKW